MKLVAVLWLAFVLIMLGLTVEQHRSGGSHCRARYATARCEAWLR